jgi:hypothetical protein
LEKIFKEMSMKIANFFLSLGFLAALLSGCFNPITMVPPKLGDPATDPFTVDIMIGKDGQARAIAGPDVDGIKDGILNIIQLVVVDKDAGNIVAFDEVREQTITKRRLHSRLIPSPSVKPTISCF